jgi:EpsD family peptidyl-prolyl cis-trans isomerase
MKRDCVRLALSGAMLFALSGCGREATGQTVAIVNDEEVSQSELNAELQSANVPPDADKSAVMPQLLQAIVDRKLLAQRAIDQGIDRSPEYLTQERRLREELLIRMMTSREAVSMKAPTDAEIKRFIADNPTMFAERASLAVDQVQFDPPTNVRVLAQLKDDKSLDEIAATLTGLRIPFTRNRARLDTGTLPTEVAKQIVSLPPGKPFVVPANGRVVANVITSRDPIAVPPDQLRQAATQRIRQQKLDEILARHVEEARKAAEIEYQDGYAPVAARGNR